jgi:stage II sporulation protein AA (anti-sigma F factor antagonist)
MYLQFKLKNEILIAVMAGELDHHSAEEVRNKIDNELDIQDLRNLILDFAGVTFMDSSGIGVVIGRYKKLSLKKGRVSVINVNNNIKRVFELSGMVKIIQLYDNLEQAVNSY